jgi:hypothetical protein
MMVEYDGCGEAARQSSRRAKVATLAGQLKAAEQQRDPDAAHEHAVPDDFDRAIYADCLKARQLITKVGISQGIPDLCTSGPIVEKVEELCSLFVERSGAIKMLKAERDELKQRLAKAEQTAQSTIAPAKTAG